MFAAWVSCVWPLLLFSCRTAVPDLLFQCCPSLSDVVGHGHGRQLHWWLCVRVKYHICVTLSVSFCLPNLGYVTVFTWDTVTLDASIGSCRTLTYELWVSECHMSGRWPGYTLCYILSLAVHLLPWCKGCRVLCLVIDHVVVFVFFWWLCLWTLSDICCSWTLGTGGVVLPSWICHSINTMASVCRCNDITL